MVLAESDNANSITAMTPETILDQTLLRQKKVRMYLSGRLDVILIPRQRFD